MYLLLSLLGLLAVSHATMAYTSGWCRVHLTQYQKTEPSNPSPYYGLTITLQDAVQEVVGEVTMASAPANQQVLVDGALPYVFIATTGAVDNDPIHFAYAGQNWDSSSGQCNVGGYDQGARNMDCDFSC
jgi:hypothetical protein